MMYEYEVYYRLDESDFFNTQSTTINAESVEELFDEIRQIENRNTILWIKNLNFNLK